MMDTGRVAGNKSPPLPLTRHSPGPALTLVTPTSQHKPTSGRTVLHGEVTLPSYPSPYANINDHNFLV